MVKNHDDVKAVNTTVVPGSSPLTDGASLLSSSSNNNINCNSSIAATASPESPPINNNDNDNTTSGEMTTSIVESLVMEGTNNSAEGKLESNEQQRGQASPNDSDQTPPPQQSPKQKQKVTKLYKSSRVKGYITLSLASYINYDAADKSNDVAGSTTSIAALDYQRRFAMAVAIVSLIITLSVLVIHIDRITPAEKIWLSAFKPGSKIEMIIAVFLVIWWSVGVGFNTSVAGIAGDGKGQYSLYYSSWVCCITSYWVLERWWVATGWSSFRAFISSWPHRSPAWILIMFLSFFTLIWYLDLRHNHVKLSQDTEILNWSYFNSISKGQWQLLFCVTSFTFIPSTLFVLAELFRDSNAEGKIESKSKAETIVEGVCFLVITLMWIPTVMIATTPGGAASLIGNAYFFTWLLVVVVFEGVVWYIHDIRKEQHQALRMKEAEYKKRQQRVLDQTLALQNQHLSDWDDRAMMAQDSESRHHFQQQQHERHNRLQQISSSEIFSDAQETK